MQIKSALDLLGFDCDPDELTERIGRTPTRHFRKGNVPSAGAAPYPQSGWIIASAVMDNLSMSAHVAGTLELAQLIRPRIPDYTAEKTISFALYMSPGEAPIFYLEPFLLPPWQVWRSDLMLTSFIFRDSDKHSWDSNDALSL